MPDKRATQSKLNGSKSTGPTTPEGKARCKESGRKGGRARAHSSVLPGESLAEFEAFRLQHYAMWQPANVMETQLADELGLERFTTVLKDYAAAHWEGVATGDDFRSAVGNPIIVGVFQSPQAGCGSREESPVVP